MNILDAFTDFILSREAMNVTSRTLDYYNFYLSKFTGYLKTQSIEKVEGLSSFHVRLFLKSLRDRELSDSYIHCFARVIRTFSRFLYKEEHISKPIHFEMPKIADKNLRVLSVDEIQRVLASCNTMRDKLIIMLFVDSGVRLAELCKLNWSDINLDSGSVVVREGKGRKFRVVGIGIKTRRLLLKYKSQIDLQMDETPLIQTYQGTRLTTMGVRSSVTS